MMAEADIAALLLTTEPELRYFSGFLTQFWQSPTRPWFIVVPRAGKPDVIGVAPLPERFAVAGFDAEPESPDAPAPVVAETDAESDNG